LTPGNPVVFDSRWTQASGPSTLRESFKTRLQTVRPWCGQAIVFLLSFAILVSRRPDAIFRPQFWAEDGWLFYAQAYNGGLVHPLFWTYSGYLLIFSRLVAALAQFFPLASAPLLFNLVAMTVQILPVQILLSSRLSAIGSLPSRLLMALLYLSLPNSFEIHATLANVHWNMAILAFLVIVSAPPRSRVARTFDYLVVLMTGLTGPFAVMLTPAAFLDWRKNRGRWKLILTSTVAACAGVQGFLILIAGRSHRVTDALNASWVSLMELLADHVFLGSLIGRNALFHGRPLGALVVTFLGIVALLYGLIRGPLHLRLFILFANLVLACALASPLPTLIGMPTGPPLPGWRGLELGLGQRYWYIPMLAFVATLVWLLKPAIPTALRLGAILCFVLMPFGVVRDWRHPPRVNLHFEEYAEKLKQAPQGTVLVIPINPPGWSMRVVKR
jgi:hypothetical protein